MFRSIDCDDCRNFPPWMWRCCVERSKTPRSTDRAHRPYGVNDVAAAKQALARSKYLNIRNPGGHGAGP